MLSLLLAFIAGVAANPASPASPAREHGAVRVREAEAFARARAGDHAGSTERLARLLAEFPRSERACLWQERVFLDAVAGDDPHAMWDAASELVARWDTLPGEPRTGALRRVCRNDVAGALRYLAVRWHNEGVETCDRERLDLADRAYRTYLAVFSKDRDSYELQFYHAELLRYLAERAMRGPGGACHGVTCGTARLREQEDRRRRGELPRSCDPSGPALDDPPHCALLHEARAAYVSVLELDPEGRHTIHAAYGQLLMAAYLTDLFGRDRVRTCKVNAEGVCVVPGARPPRSTCREPTRACHEHLARADRWPTAALLGLPRLLPFPRSP